MFYVLIIVAAISIISFAIGSYSDVKKRTVKTYLFIPLVVSGLVFDYISSVPSAILIIAAVAFVFTFIRTEIYLYAILGIAIMMVSLVSVIYIGIFYGFTLIFISFIFLLGYTEKLFGIGDIKGIIAALVSMAALPISTAQRFSTMSSIFPLTFLIILNLGFISILVFPYVGMINKKEFGRMYFVYSPYKEGLNPVKYSIKTFGEKKYSAYRIPFMVPIFLTVVITYISYFAGGLF